jgi:hypothetical protein
VSLAEGGLHFVLGLLEVGEGGVLRHYDQFGSVAYWLQVLSATTVTV